MKKYLVNRILRSIFSVLMVMIISIVLIFSLVPLSYVVDGNADIADAKRNGGADAGSIKTLEVLKKYGYIEYVSQEDYCKSIYSSSGERYSTCIAKLDTNPDKQNYLKKYRDLGWTEVKLVQAEKDHATIVTRDDVNNGLYTLQDGDYYKNINGQIETGAGSLEDEVYNAKGDVVTINNVVYFQKKVNPLKVFWDWFTGLITFDHKNKVENYVQWDREEGKYLTENDVYQLTFEYVRESDNKLNKSKPYEYIVDEKDGEMSSNVITIKTSSNEYKEVYAVGGISSGVLVDEKTLDSVGDITKKYNDSNDPHKGGELEITLLFSDGTSQTFTKEVAMYLNNDIPLYAGDDGKWYIGNSKQEIDTMINVRQTNKDANGDWIYKYAENKFSSYQLTEASLKRGYSVKLDEYGAPALTCAGCEHKYLVYFDNQFPYIHFNFVNISLGESINNFAGLDIIDIMTNKQGAAINDTIKYPSGDEAEGSVSSFHTCTYKNTLLRNEQKLFNDNYATCQQSKVEHSMIGISFIMGIFATLIAYFVGVPIGVVMARNKDKLFDKIAMVYIIIMFSVPSLAYIYFFSMIGTKVFDLKMQYEFGNIATYILPIVSLSLGSIASMMMWTRRYMIDQGNSDYVKFARAKGLSEGQIFFKHILRNAIVPIAHGIPGSLFGAIAGALVTEKVYAVPGTGKLMVDAMTTHDNNIAIGLIFFYTILGITSLILGDVVITLVDPRISFVDTGGRK